MKSSNAVSLAVATLSVFTLMVPELAHAQAGGGQASGLIDWVVTTLGRPMLNGGILMIAFVLLCARVNLGVVCMVAAGGLVFANHSQIAGLFGF